jgi:hypothetical protein
MSQEEEVREADAHGEVDICFPLHADVVSVRVEFGPEGHTLCVTTKEEHAERVSVSLARTAIGVLVECRNKTTESVSEKNAEILARFT